MDDQIRMESMLPELFQQAIWLEALQRLSYALMIILCGSLVFVLLDFVFLFRQGRQAAARRQQAAAGAQHSTNKRPAAPALAEIKKPVPQRTLS